VKRWARERLFCRRYARPLFFAARELGII